MQAALLPVLCVCEKECGTDIMKEKNVWCPGACL